MHRQTTQQQGRSRCRHRQEAVFGLDKAASQRHGRGIDMFHFQIFKTDCHGNDIHNGVNRPDLMEMHILDRNPMHRSFSLG